MRQYTPNTEVDFVVIGSGAAGGIMAKQLSQAGFSVVVLEQGPWSLGRLCAVRRDPASGIVSAGANPRGMQGYAVGR